MKNEAIKKTTMSRNLELFGDNTPTKVVTSEDLRSMCNEDLQQMLLNEMVRRQQVTFTCIGKQVTMSVQELIDYYIDTECANTANECGF